MKTIENTATAESAARRIIQSRYNRFRQTGQAANGLFGRLDTIDALLFGLDIIDYLKATGTRRVERRQRAQLAYLTVEELLAGKAQPEELVAIINDLLGEAVLDGPPALCGPKNNGDLLYVDNGPVDVDRYDRWDLLQEESIIWLHPPENYDYLRECVVGVDTGWTPTRPPRTHVVAYAQLHTGSRTIDDLNGLPNYRHWRYWYAMPQDRFKGAFGKGWDNGGPGEAVVPTSVFAGSRSIGGWILPGRFSRDGGNP